LNNNDDLLIFPKGELIITEDQIPKFKELINNLPNLNSIENRPPLPKPPEPEVMYENNGTIGIVIGIVVLGIIVVMILSKII